MKCPICGKLLPPNTDRCADCGYRVTGSYSEQASTGYYTPPNRTGRKKGCCCALILVIPLLLLLAGAVFGAVQFVQSEFSTQEFEFFEDTPLEDFLPESLPAAADEGAFSIRDGAVTFRPEDWDGSPVLRIPETVDGEAVTAIAPGCFRDCGFLTTIVLPETVTGIGREAFAGCGNLRGLFLPEGLETIGMNAFSGCGKMEAISIPSSITEIAPGCFDDCAALIFLFYNGEFEAWESIYSDFINPYTAAICTDGTYYHGTGR